MATEKQVKFLRLLMVELGYAHKKGFLNATSKELPHNPTMKERSGSVDDWANRLTTKQASEVISFLLKKKEGDG